jgi:antitoxin ParD1/3/4
MEVDFPSSRWIMSTQLSPENEQYLQNAVSTGLFHDRGEALDKAVDLLKKRELLLREVNRGIEQLEQGEGIPFDLEALRAEIHAKFATP